MLMSIISVSTYETLRHDACLKKYNKQVLLRQPKLDLRIADSRWAIQEASFILWNQGITSMFLGSCPLFLF
jgi:hypothetical protein